MSFAPVTGEVDTRSLAPDLVCHRGMQQEQFHFQRLTLHDDLHKAVHRKHNKLCVKYSCTAFKAAILLKSVY